MQYGLTESHPISTFAIPDSDSESARLTREIFQRIVIYIDETSGRRGVLEV